jgi:hypothetical protein
MGPVAQVRRAARYISIEVGRSLIACPCPAAGA